MWHSGLEERSVKLANEKDRSALVSFLEKQGLTLDHDVEYSMVIMDNGTIAATGSFAGRVLKCIAVDEAYKGTGLSEKVITNLANEQFRRGRSHYFVFTKPQNKQIFADIGLSLIAEVPAKVVLMENRHDGIQKFLDELAAESGDIVPSAAVVVNCNPFTLGHRYLLEYAAARCQKLHVFVVWEDRSVFPSEARYHMVKEGTADLSNVVVHRGRDYIISDATFPTYFIKRYEDVVETHARLDVTIFLQYIVRKLAIQKRFVGDEPYCRVTSEYNRVMAEMLPPAGVDLEIVPRKTSGGTAISASRVRELLRTDDLPAVKELVPESTFRFLSSAKVGEIIQKIRSSASG